MAIEAAADTADRPREKLARTGVSALDDSELLALVLGHGAAGHTALQLACLMLKDMGGVHGLTKVSADRLTHIAGVGPAQSSRVLAAIELGRRTLFISPQARLPLRSPRDFARLLVPRFGAHPVAAIARAAAVVVFHNHPSGDPKPTESDLALTRRLIDAGTIVGIEVLDHLILTDTVYCSLRQAAGASWHG
jgi:DNA repair protein RadC